MALVPEEDRADARSGKVAKAAVVTTGGAVLACAACCVLPVAFPAIALAGAGVTMIAFGAMYRLLTVAGAIIVIAAWAWVVAQSRRADKRPAPKTVRWLAVATGLAALAAAWPFIEPVVIGLLR